MGKQVSREIRHYEDSTTVSAPPEEVFNYVDDHANFSSHMNKSSWMMGGGKMDTQVDEGRGQKVGSHIQMNGEIFGIKLSLDEVVTVHEPPLRKVWKTVGIPKLIVISDYELGLQIKPTGDQSNLTVFINYDLPKSWRTCWLGHLFGGIYAKWCVGQMVNGTQNHFMIKNPSK